MDSKFQLLGFGGSLWTQNAFQMQSKTQPKFDIPPDARHVKLCPHSTGSSNSHDMNMQDRESMSQKNIRGIKRKWRDARRYDKSSLSLSPSLSDLSSTSSTSLASLSPAREPDEESSMDIELNFHLHLGGNETLKPMTDALDAARAVKSAAPSLPKLSPVSSSASSITTISPDCVHRVEFCVGTPPSTIEAASVDSAKRKPVLAAAPSSSSVTCISDHEHMQYTWSSETEWFHGYEGRVRGRTNRVERAEHNDLYLNHGSCRMCSREDCRKWTKDGCLSKKMPDSSCKRKIECHTSGHGDRMCQMGNHLQSTEDSYNLYCSDWRGDNCPFPKCPQPALTNMYICNPQYGGLGGYCAAPDCTRRAREGSSFCFSHGRGKRCQMKGCTKSAKASMDFCKLHGGGKKSLSGHPGSECSKGGLPNDHCEREGIGPLSVPKVPVQDQRVHGGKTIISGRSVSELHFHTIEPAGLCAWNKHGFINTASIIPHSQFDAMNGNVSRTSPVHSISGIMEGRVHGGSLMAALNNGTTGEGGRCTP